MSRVAEIKSLVEQRKAKVREAQTALTDHNLKHGVMPPWKWQEISRRLKDDLRHHLRLLGETKAEMVKLCGTTGSDPKWGLLVDAYRILHRLEESGVDIGDDGQKLLDDISFHVPLAKLDEAVAGDVAAK